MKEDLLDRYAFDTLTAKDKTWIKQEVEKNPNFQKELDLHFDIIKGLDVHMSTLFNLAFEEMNSIETDKIKNKIKEVEEELEKEGFFENTPLEKIIIQSIKNEGEKELKTTLKKVDQELEKEGFFEEKSLNLEKIAQEIIEIEGEKELKTTLKKIDQELETEGFFETKQKTKTQQKNTPVYSLLKITLAAASILLVLTFGWEYMSNNSNNPTSFEWENNLLVHYNNTLSQQTKLELSEMGFAGNPEKKPLEELLLAMDAYDAKEYSSACKKLEIVLQKEIDKDFKNTTQLYLATSYLLDNQLKKATTLLQELSELESLQQNQKETSIWYLALAHLKNKNLGLAKTQLEKLKNSTTYRTAAQELLRKI